MPIDTAAFIRRHLEKQIAPMLPELVLYLAHPGSGLSRLEDDAPPYWAYLWPGGALLARYFLDGPARVKGLSVLDIGTGGGVVALAAAKAGAVRVIANDIDARAIAAVSVNAEANDLEIETLCGDVLDGDVPDVDLVTVGDLFFHADTAARVTAFARRCVAAGKTVLVGDIGRAHLPCEVLLPLAEYDVPDFGERRDTSLRTGTVYRVDAEKAAPGAAFSNARSGTG
ncbi:MAG TPA: methyltransferase domain-containing protein [Rhizomicrobium sp.]|nr:methyltransferase domain-containing protein [Rhizomicrobium sp.]